VVSRAIQTELVRTGAKCVYLDATRIPRDRLYARFPTVCRFLSEYGIDPARDPIPVTPAAHYMIGGVTTDLEGRTSLAGLLACGEVAATGVHGANRLASNSLLEGLVFGERVVHQLVHPTPGGPPTPRHDAALRLPRGEGVGVDLRITERVRDLLWEQVGIVRTGPELRGALTTLEEMGERTEPDEAHGLAGSTANHVLLARLIARSALRREESRGAHFRTDHPEHVGRWRVHLSLHPGRHR
jgi:L-aspartate oxidase